MTMQRSMPFLGINTPKPKINLPVLKQSSNKQTNINTPAVEKQLTDMTFGDSGMEDANNSGNGELKRDIHDLASGMSELKSSINTLTERLNGVVKVIDDNKDTRERVLKLETRYDNMEKRQADTISNNRWLIGFAMTMFGVLIGLVGLLFGHLK